MLCSPLLTVVLVVLLTALRVLFDDVDAISAVDRQPHDGQPVTHSAPPSIARHVRVQHKYLGDGLKRDLLVEIDASDLAAAAQQEVKWRLTFDMPRSLIVDVFRLNRLHSNRLEGEAYQTDQPVDLESGAWKETSRPFRLTAQFRTRDSAKVSLVIPEVMARYHLPDANCFALGAPRVEAWGAELAEGLHVHYPEPLEQCVPVSRPSVLVPALTLLTPIASCMYLINLMKST